MKKYLAAIAMIAILSLPSCFALSRDYFGHPNDINYATNYETQDFGSLQFYYDGYVQGTPSYNHQGSHALQGKFIYTLPNGTVHRYSTDLANSTSTSGVLSRTGKVYDDYFDWGTKTKFNYSFTWVPPGTSVNSVKTN